MSDVSALLSKQMPVLPGSNEKNTFLDSVFEVAPYLRRLAARRPETLEACWASPPEVLLEQAIEAAREAGRTSTDISVLDSSLRQLKADMHLVVGLADLAGRWTVKDVTQSVARFADVCVHAALYAHVRFYAEKGRVFPVESANNPLPGLFVLALGKMGADELNYSSDIDLVCFFDPDIVRLPDNQNTRKCLPRLIQAVVKTLQEVTADGYVFRTDLRLRPDPGASPVAMSSEAALNYYESMGQTWERAAWIKARPCGGDFEAAQAYLKFMQPFIWRRALDFAAVDDIRGLARQIQTVGSRANICPAGHDLKLGRGGIREIEFYAQIPQLVFGGRDPSVRMPATLDALKALKGRGVVSDAALKCLRADYETLRAWEHRIQMCQDEASQTLPKSSEERVAIAAMAGFAELEDFDQSVEALLRRVHGHFSDQFHDENALSSKAGSLVLTGVEPTPDTLKTLHRLGFEKPDQIWKTLNGWAAGRIKALRSSRARNLFAKIASQLVDVMSDTGEPDAAFIRFSAFIENLPYGVQPLSLMMNEPHLAADLISILTMAPRMAQALARRPDLLDVMLDRRFSIPLDQDAPDDFHDRLAQQIEHSQSYEEALNLARRNVREERFRVGSQVLNGAADARTAGAAYTAIADATIECMALAAERETCRRFGPMPGQYVIMGMGKLGGGELSADSDVDLVIVFEDCHETESGAQTWFTRFAQRFISALSVPTEEGELYEVDMQLRPSGKAGPVAVQFSRFASYYFDEAWTWELMALTRSRIVAGNAGLGDKVSEAVDHALQKKRSPETLLKDARNMRARLEQEKPASSEWDIKARAGGLQDIEFIAQSLQIISAPTRDVVRGSTASALSALVRADIMDVEDARFLTETAHLYLGLSQLIRSAHGAGFDPAQASAGFAKVLASLIGEEALGNLKQVLDARCQQVRQLYEHYLQVE